jgi:hypothetical protein
VPLALLLVVFFAAQAFADTPPVPKIFKDMQGQKGQYQLDLPDSAGALRRLILCTDNLMPPNEGKRDCKYRLLKDTADEAVIEATCAQGTSTVTVKRDSAKTMLMTVRSENAKGPQVMRMRYTHLGACREGQPEMALPEPDVEQCQKLKARLLQISGYCALRSDNSYQCHQHERRTREQIAREWDAAMCGG